MDRLRLYIKECIKPRDDTEYFEGDEQLSNMVQDGLMFVKKCPNGDDVERVRVGDWYIARKCKKQLEWLEPDGSMVWDVSSIPIYRRLLPPPCETVNHKLIMECVIRETSNGDKNYVEYGVRTGESVNYISKVVNHAYGVDIGERPYLERNVTYFRAYTDWFSEEVLPTLKYDYAFVDADHSHEASMKDFESLYKHLQPGGYIFLHDTYPCELRFLDKGGCFDCYKTPMAIKEKYKGIEMVTLPLNPGLTIVRKS